MAEREDIHKNIRKLYDIRTMSNGDGVSETKRRSEIVPTAERQGIGEFGCKAFDVRTTSNEDGMGETKPGGRGASGGETRDS